MFVCPGNKKHRFYVEAEFEEHVKTCEFIQKFPEFYVCKYRQTHIFTTLKLKMAHEIYCHRRFQAASSNCLAPVKNPYYKLKQLNNNWISKGEKNNVKSEYRNIAQPTPLFDSNFLKPPVMPEWEEVLSKEVSPLTVDDYPIKRKPVAIPANKANIRVKADAQNLKPGLPSPKENPNNKTLIFQGATAPNTNLIDTISTKASQNNKIMKNTAMKKKGIHSAKKSVQEQFNKVTTVNDPPEHKDETLLGEIKAVRSKLRVCEDFHIGAYLGFEEHRYYYTFNLIKHPRMDQTQIDNYTILNLDAEYDIKRYSSQFVDKNYIGKLVFDDKSQDIRLIVEKLFDFKDRLKSNVLFHNIHCEGVEKYIVKFCDYEATLLELYRYSEVEEAKVSKESIQSQDNLFNEIKSIREELERIKSSSSYNNKIIKDELRQIHMENNQMTGLVSQIVDLTAKNINKLTSVSSSNFKKIAAEPWGDEQTDKKKDLDRMCYEQNETANNQYYGYATSIATYHVSNYDSKLNSCSDTKQNCSSSTRNTKNSECKKEVKAEWQLTFDLDCPLSEQLTYYNTKENLSKPSDREKNNKLSTVPTQKEYIKIEDIPEPQIKGFHDYSPNQPKATKTTASVKNNMSSSSYQKEIKIAEFPVKVTSAQVVNQSKSKANENKKDDDNREITAKSENETINNERTGKSASQLDTSKLCVLCNTRKRNMRFIDCGCLIWCTTCYFTKMGKRTSLECSECNSKITAYRIVKLNN